MLREHFIPLTLNQKKEKYGRYVNIAKTSFFARVPTTFWAGKTSVFGGGVCRSIADTGKNTAYADNIFP